MLSPWSYATGGCRQMITIVPEAVAPCSQVQASAWGGTTQKRGRTAAAYLRPGSLPCTPGPVMGTNTTGASAVGFSVSRFFS